MEEEDIKLIEDPEDIQLNEDREIQQILGDPPGWILRWGISLVFLTVMVLLIMGWVIKYPDVISVPFILTTENPPIEVFSRTAGKIKTLKTQAQDQVKAGDLLAIIENPADLNAILALEKVIIPINADPSLEKLLKAKLPENGNLGTLQPVYANLSKSLDELRYEVYQNNTLQQLSALEKQIEEIKSLNQSLEKQKSILMQVVDLEESNFVRNQETFKEKLTSKEALETAHSNFLQRKQSLESLNSEVINNRLRVEQLSLNKMQMRQGQKDEQFPRYFSAQENLRGLKSEIEKWKENFLISAPISGTVEMDKVWTASQFLNINEELLTIVPDNVSNIVRSQSFLPYDGAGKVVAGETPANLRLNAYPFKEFGIIRSQVKSIAEVPQQEGYLMEFEMPQPLITSYDKEIPFRQGMQGSARLVTKDRRILERVFDQIISALKNSDSD